MKLPFQIARILIYLLAAWTIGFGYFYTQLPSRVSELELLPVDGAAVFTGGPGRIEAGLELVSSKVAPQLLISGVNPAVTSEDLRQRRRGSASLFACCVALGYAATDTRSNATETAAWARKNNVKRLILVTADHHMPRAALLLRDAIPEVEIIAYPVHDDARLGRFLQEYHKYIFTLFHIGFT